MTLALLSSQLPSRLQLQQQPLHLMGYWPPGLGEAARALWLTALLFAGPLYESLVVDGAARQWTTLQPLKELWVDWPTWRNMVAVRIAVIIPVQLVSFHLALSSPPHTDATKPPSLPTPLLFHSFFSLFLC